MVDVRRVSNEDERAAAFEVRRRVFVDEQGVAEDLEYDDHDETADHFVACDGEEAVGAARLRAVDSGVGKVERVAVVRSRREQGVGRALMAAVEDRARERDLEALTLHSQTHAAEFYERLGYERRGEVFEEAGIPHVAMRTPLE